MNDPTASEAQALAAYDEQLRCGIEVVATGSTAEGSGKSVPADLAECLRRIERVWPRAEEPYSPTQIGRFVIERVVGQGSFGTVYLAHDPLLGRKVALKVPRFHTRSSEHLRELFRREGRATAALDHPNIVPVHELGEAESLSYIAFAFCSGPNLAEWLKSQAEPVPPQVAAWIVQQLAEAMHYSHSRGVLHRDLKPNNVLLFPLTNSQAHPVFAYVPRIVDFGLARLAEEDLEATGTSAVIGTPLYMAPEQALGRRDAIGPAADIYSLGTILYELLSGRPPFFGTSPLEVMDHVRSTEPPSLSKAFAHVPRDLETICLHCLEKQPEDRYPSARELAADLQNFCEGRDVQARPISIWQRALRVCQQPQRIHEAGLTVIGTHAAVIMSMLMTLYMVEAGQVIERPANFSLLAWAPKALLFMVGGHLPMLYVGWMLLRQRLWAAWFSLIAGAVMVLASLFFVVGAVPAGMTDWDQIPGFRIVYPLMAVLFIVQTTMSAVAVLALRRLRK
ncbi:serine/threonine-protein kinase [Anatilimnocola sp. NA78]|uniref:serine/threonine-protein kinase n=1 Tax=Anatilimnocola sp. NA78 TaxID=3415683 RepID=UPI003CE4E7C1